MLRDNRAIESKKEKKFTYIIAIILATKRDICLKVILQKEILNARENVHNTNMCDKCHEKQRELRCIVNFVFELFKIISHDNKKNKKLCENLS